MPKDNEVDEKVTPVVWWVPNARSCQDGSWEEGPGYLKFADETDGAERKYGTALYSAATVAELRAEVERLNACIDAIHENWMNYGPHREIVARADAAERRVGELTSLLSDTVGNLHRMGNNEFADCDQERLDIVISRIERTLTGADPT